MANETIILSNEVEYMNQVVGENIVETALIFRKRCLQENVATQIHEFVLGKVLGMKVEVKLTFCKD